jgi:molybdopterin/thiamine biosynthesis adenylyltransferase
MTFTSEERERYARHILLKEIGGVGQQRLKRASVALVGAGGLGAPAALYLAAAGVGRLMLIDDDVVSLSNLQRQVLYRTEDEGTRKVDAAAAHLGALNPHIVVEKAPVRLDHANAAAHLADVDLVLDGTDSFATRFAVNAACHALGLPLISGAVGRWSGQVATFKSGLTKALPAAIRAPCYQCLVPAETAEAEACDRTGIVGALTGIIGAMMALEAIKEISGAGEGLAGRLLLFDGLGADARLVRLNADPNCPVCGDAHAQSGAQR